MKKSIVLCADDYGQAPSISRAIVKLLEKRRLSAVSCLVNAPYWQEHAGWLAPHASEVDLGLHFNLTEGEPLSSAYRATYGPKFACLSTVMLKALLHQFDQAVIAAELNAQIDSFVEATGCLPSFIDGHQHVHQLPSVRNAFLQVYLARLSVTKPYVRLVYQPLKWGDGRHAIKKLAIRLLGASAFKKALEAEAIPHNTSFAGMYAFGDKGSYAARLKAFMREVGDHGLIMCHPGEGEGVDDPIAAARLNEYTYLASPQFPEDCETLDVTLKRPSNR